MNEFYAPMTIMSINPAMPRLYAQIKIHKQGLSIRPVVTYNKTPAYKLNKWLDKTVKEILKYKEKQTIKNNLKIKNKIQDLTGYDNMLLWRSELIYKYTSRRNN